MKVTLGGTGLSQCMRLVPLGACSAIGKPQVAVGDVIEVAYLWWAGGSLVQPRMKQVRDDKVPADCTLEQLPFYTREVV